MKLRVLDSGSSGNCYLLENDKEILILELGISIKRIVSIIDPYKVVGALVTHEHKDHSKAIKEAIQRGIKIYATQGTIKACLDEKNYFCKEIAFRQEYKIGSFKVIPFQTEHDAAEPCGFLIKHKDMGTLLFATDTYYVRYNFKHVNHWMIECNYSAEILDRNVALGHVPPRLADRIITSHFELDHVKEFFLAKDLRQTRNIVLLHLSDSNSNEVEFQQVIEKATRKQTHIANKGLVVDLSLCPF